MTLRPSLRHSAYRSVTSVPSVTNVRCIFLLLPRLGSFCSLRLRLRHCLLWCRELSMLSRTFVFAGFLGVWCRAFRARIVYMFPRGHMVSSSLRGAAHSMVPRTCMLPRTSVAAHSSFGRAFVYCRAPMVTRSYTCCRAVLRAAQHRSFVAAQFSILPRTVACGRAVIHAAAQFHVPPSMSAILIGALPGDDL